MDNNFVGKALEELYRVFDILNKDKFDGQLGTPVITIQKSKMACYRYFMPVKCWANKNSELPPEVDDDAYYEINIDPRYFNERDAAEIVGTLLHEMCHYWNKMNSIKDCSGNGRVHNKKFKSVAESVGFEVLKEKGYGFGRTNLTEELRNYIETEVVQDESVFEYFRLEPTKTKETKKRKKLTFSYTCPKCGMTVKGKKGITVNCGLCDVNLEIEDVEEDEDENNESES